MKIFDCFPFYNELDLLELRLNELYDHVDRFVLVEANTTFTSKTKPFYFEENKFIKKNKNLNDIKLRLISILIFILPLYVLFVQEPFFYILKETLNP